MKQPYLFILLLLLIISCNSKQLEKPYETKKLNVDSSAVDTVKELPLPVISIDTFAMAVGQLMLDYKLEVIIKTDSLPYLNDIEKAKWFFNRLKACSERYPILKSIKPLKLNALKSTSLKSVIPLESHPFLKFNLEEWEFQSETDAIQFYNQLSEKAMGERDCINKGGIEWWRHGKNIYFIHTKAFRFMYEYDKIHASLAKWGINGR